MKKLLIVIVILSLFIVLFACKDGNNSDEDVALQNERVASLVDKLIVDSLYDDNGIPGDFYLPEKFTAYNTNYKYKYEFAGQYSNYFSIEKYADDTSIRPIICNSISDKGLYKVSISDDAYTNGADSIDIKVTIEMEDNESICASKTYSFNLESDLGHYLWKNGFKLSYYPIGSYEIDDKSSSYSNTSSTTKQTKSSTSDYIAINVKSNNLQHYYYYSSTTSTITGQLGNLSVNDSKSTDSYNAVYNFADQTLSYSEKSTEVFKISTREVNKDRSIATKYESVKSRINPILKYIELLDNYFININKEYVSVMSRIGYNFDDYFYGYAYKFGSYPQTKVFDTTITSALNTQAGTLPTSANSQSWTDYGYYVNGSVLSYMWYQDIEYEREKYRGVYFTQYRPASYFDSSLKSNTNQDDNNYLTSKVYWFRFEPIRWRVLTELNGNALLLSDIILDSQAYEHNQSTSTYSHNGEIGYANNYELSYIRLWLNDNFYNTAFNINEKSKIMTTMVDNSTSTTRDSSNSYVCSNTNDNVFLLSFSEATNSSYGLDNPTARQAVCSDYAKAQGLYVNKDYSNGYTWGYWWLRSPNSSYANNAEYAYGYTGSSQVYKTSYGVCPAIWISLDDNN